MVVIENGQYPVFHSMVCQSYSYINRENCVNNGVKEGVKLVLEELSDSES